MERFENLRKNYIASQERQKTENAFYIENGFCESWADEHKTPSDEGIRRYSTETRWNQYKSGVISREKAVNYAIARNNKAIDKKTAKTLERVEKIENAPDLRFISLDVVYNRSSVWGWNPTAYARTNNADTVGSASGCGYDKESAAVASAFNGNCSILKVLYSLKEKALANGESDYSKTSCTHVDNRNIIGYGAGYSILPYFEGGVGINCFISILEKAGYKTRANYGKHENFYSIYQA